jgi:hypothetical protein
MIDYNVLMESIKRPIVRAETVLDGVFADGVIVVESDGDRAVYQAALEAARSDGRFDVLFVPVGGHGGIPSIATFYKRLQIPVAVIADLDIVLEQSQLRCVLNRLAQKESDTVEAIIGICDQVSEQIMTIPPPIDPSEIQAALNTLAEQREWKNNDNTVLMNLLRQMSNKLDRRKVLKAGGLSALGDHPEIKQLVDQIIDRCKPLGLFLVPVGELEYWAPDVMEGISKRKAEWANEAALRIAKGPEKATDVIGFVRAIAAVLEDERNKQVSSTTV